MDRRTIAATQQKGFEPMVVTKAEVDAVVLKETHVKAEALREEATLTDLEIDSLDMVSIVFALEDKFKVSLEPDDVAQVQTYRQFIDLVSAKAA